jgi:hypothetical protein
MIAEARRVMLADEGAVALSLAQDGGKQESLTASEIVERMVDAAPAVTLSEDKVTEEGLAADGKPEVDTSKEKDVKLSREVKSLASSLYLEGNMSQDHGGQEAPQGRRRHEGVRRR